MVSSETQILDFRHWYFVTQGVEKEDSLFLVSSGLYKFKC